MNSTRTIGLHVRFRNSLQELIERAHALHLSFFQFFLVTKGSGRLISTTQEDIQSFIALRRLYFQDVYVHGSYWINLAGMHHNGFQAFRRELSMAKNLEATHMVIHPGTANGGNTKQEGIQALAKALNRIFKSEHHIKIVLENTAHGGLSVGGDLQDFVELRAQLNHPEKLLICIDTAHAYSYGYDLVDGLARETFIQFLYTTIGIDAIPLLHFNDTTEKCGSKIDKHVLLGQGHIGKDALKALVMDDRLKTIPLLMELPIVSQEEEEKMLALVRGWHT